MSTIILLFHQLHPVLNPFLNCQERFLQSDSKCRVPKKNIPYLRRVFTQKSQNRLWENQTHYCFSGLAIMLLVNIVFLCLQCEQKPNLICEILFQIIRKALTEEKQVSTKTSAADLVTETDHFVENLIISVLKEKFPSHR